ncbi:MAG: TrkA C-terminal domain-containing protein [Candidatus Sulfotelmatobacter sp.]
MEIGEIHIASRSVLAGATIESSGIRQDGGVMILASKRHAGMRFNPAPHDHMAPEDCLIATLSHYERRFPHQLPCHTAPDSSHATDNGMTVEPPDVALHAPPSKEALQLEF